MLKYTKYANARLRCLISQRLLCCYTSFARVLEKPSSIPVLFVFYSRLDSRQFSCFNTLLHKKNSLWSAGMIRGATLCQQPTWLYRLKKPGGIIRHFEKPRVKWCDAICRLFFQYSNAIMETHLVEINIIQTSTTLRFISIYILYDWWYFLSTFTNPEFFLQIYTKN